MTDGVRYLLMVMVTAALAVPPLATILGGISLVTEPIAAIEPALHAPTVRVAGLL